MTTLPLGASPANPTPMLRISASVAKAVDMARLHLRTGNPGAYARSLSAEHRAGSARQQRAVEAIIAADATSHLFTRHPANGCLLAQEG